ncbi:MAG: alpha-D-glucose phosphate-specific phosphoglucomutase [Proteobacteria bacterium]|nr:MAG: alpha-D-glucose phosphate-specific phosphoglucomutase [Pseudomonadota bacterium]
MSVSPLAGKPAPASILVDVPRLVTAYFAESPDPAEPSQRVAFGTSGHRGSSLRGSFHETHILAVTQAICLYRRQRGTDGPLFLGFDTHALSEPAFVSALEVLAANGVEVRVDAERKPTPTPVVSHAILGWNRGRTSGLADGILITPSHNPPEDGGFKYNPPEGGPASSEATGWIEKTANALIEANLAGVERWPIARARAAANVRPHDFVSAYVGDLGAALDLDAVRGAGLRLGVDPLGGAGAHYWARIAERWGIALEVVNPDVDPTFRFMRVDWDGKIRMDCSSPHAMAGLIALKDRFDVAFAQDTDNDRHGIVAKTVGLLNPNHYLAVAIDHLFRRRGGWAREAAVGKTVVSSSILDRVAARLGRALVEVPVGFKWFVDGLLSGSLGFGGEESAGASFLRRDGTTWTTDKDGILLSLLAAEITAVAGRDPGELYRAMTRELGDPVYERIDAAATPAQKAALGKLTPDRVGADQLAGEPVVRVLAKAPGNGAAIGGIKVESANGWFAARPSGTEDVYKIYAESFLGAEHLRRIQDEARAIVAKALAGV